MAFRLFVSKIQRWTIVRQLVSGNWFDCIPKYVSKDLLDQNIFCHTISMYLDLLNQGDDCQNEPEYLG